MTISVLVVDDQRSIRRLSRLWIEDDPDFVVVAEASDGLEAIDAAERHQPDIVLLDIAMPGMDGIVALPFLRRVAPRAIVVGYTNHVDLADRALAAGAADIFLKTQPLATVLDGLRALVARRDLREPTV